MVQFIGYLGLKEKTWVWPKGSTDKKSTFPHQNLKVRGQLLYFWLNRIVELTSSSTKTTNLYISKESWKGIV